MLFYLWLNKQIRLVWVVFFFKLLVVYFKCFFSWFLSLFIVKHYRVACYGAFYKLIELNYHFICGKLNNTAGQQE